MLKGRNKRIRRIQEERTKTAEAAADNELANALAKASPCVVSRMNATVKS